LYADFGISVLSTCTPFCASEEVSLSEEVIVTGGPDGAGSEQPYSKGTIKRTANNNTTGFTVLSPFASFHTANKNHIKKYPRCQE
jgi:hypothetical protein